MSVIVAGAGAAPPGGGGGTALDLYDENPITPAPPAAQGDNSVAIGPGATTDVVATGSIALGSQSLTRHRGALVFANDRFASSGDAQAGKYLLRTVTINSATTEAYLNGTAGGERLTLTDDSTWTFTITITGHRTDTGDGHAGYKFEGVIFRGAGAGTTTFQGVPVKNVIAESDVSWDVSITANSTFGALCINVTGQVGKTIRWVALVETVEVTN
jgi:Head domain of trimeric autotransporter adhesin